jgi:hypothetical protein
LAYFDLFWPLWNDGVVLLAENVVPKSLDWTDWEPTGPTGSESPTKYDKNRPLVRRTDCADRYRHDKQQNPFDIKMIPTPRWAR